MRLLLTFCIMLLTVFAVDAQKKKKPSVNKAKSAWEKGELDVAKGIIDEAIAYEKTMNDGKTWYYRGLIYATIDTTSSDFKSLSDNALETSIESFSKADELDDSQKGYYITAPNGLPVLKDQQMNEYFSFYFNRGVEEYETDNFQGAVSYFVNASRIIPSDTNALVNAGYAAMNADDNKMAIKYFNENIDRGARNKNVMLNIVRIAVQDEDLEGALVAVNRAKEFYPADNMIIRQEVDILRRLERLGEAIEQLEVAITNEPDDALLPFFLGILFEEDENEEKAMEAYEKAIQVDPEYFDAHFNKAALLYNKGTVLQKEKNLLGYSKEDQKKAKALEPKIKETFSAALPSWEKLYSLQPQNRDVLERLLYMYALTGQESKADKIEEELNALPADEE